MRKFDSPCKTDAILLLRSMKGCRESVNNGVKVNAGVRQVASINGQTKDSGPRTETGLALFTKTFDVFWALVERSPFAALDDLADLFDNVWIGERGDISRVHAV